MLLFVLLLRLDLDCNSNLRITRNKYGVLLNGDAVTGSHLANDHHRFGLPRNWNELQ
jgi:hypothetical protein